MLFLFRNRPLSQSNRLVVVFPLLIKSVLRHLISLNMTHLGSGSYQLYAVFVLASILSHVMAFISTVVSKHGSPTVMLAKPSRLEENADGPLYVNDRVSLCV